jgi:hypothetical protein
VAGAREGVRSDAGAPEGDAEGRAAAGASEDLHPGAHGVGLELDDVQAEARARAGAGVEVIDRIRSGLETEANLKLLRDLCGTMVDGSLCALGGMAPFPVISVMDHFPEDLGPRH